MFKAIISEMLLYDCSLFSIPALEADATENDPRVPLEDQKYFFDIVMFSFDFKL